MPQSIDKLNGPTLLDGFAVEVTRPGYRQVRARWKGNHQIPTFAENVEHIRPEMELGVRPAREDVTRPSVMAEGAKRIANHTGELARY